MSRWAWSCTLQTKATLSMSAHETAQTGCHQHLEPLQHCTGADMTSHA
jgi:hypothetical protein